MADLSRFKTREPVKAKTLAPSFDDIEAEIGASRAQANLLDDTISGDDAVKSLQLSRELGYDPASISADVGTFQTEAEIGRAGDELAQSMGLSGWLGDPTHAAASKDSLPPMGAISRMLNGVPKSDVAGTNQRAISRLRSSASPLFQP